MIRLSTKGRYGVRAMLELARHPGGEPVLMSEIAERQDISRKYLHALLTALRSAGLVRSVRGAHGGYILAKPATEIRIAEIVESLEGPFSIVDCVLDAGICPRSCDCGVRPMWDEMSRKMREYLAGISLQDLADGRLQGAGPDVAAAVQP